MNKLRVGIPAAVIALSSLTIASCSKNQEQPINSTPKIETTIPATQQDKFEKQNNTDNGWPWWGKALAVTGFVGLYGLIARHVSNQVEELKKDYDAARIYLDMNGDNYLD